MSYSIAAELNNRIIPHGLYQLLAVLAGYADDAGRKIWPSIDRLAYDAGRSRGTIKNQLSQLRDMRWLIAERPASRSRPAIYTLNLDAIPIKEPYRPRCDKPLNNDEWIAQQSLQSGDASRNRVTTRHDFVNDESSQLTPIQSRIQSIDPTISRASDSDEKSKAEIEIEKQSADRSEELQPKADGVMSGRVSKRGRGSGRLTVFDLDRIAMGKVPERPKQPTAINFDRACYPDAVDPVLEHYSLSHLISGREGFRLQWRSEVVEGVRYLSRTWITPLTMQGDIERYLAARYSELTAHCDSTSTTWYKAATILSTAYDEGRRLNEARNAPPAAYQPAQSAGQPIDMTPASPEAIERFRQMIIAGRGAA